jgi:hypothetical protein
MGVDARDHVSHGAEDASARVRRAGPDSFVENEVS